MNTETIPVGFDLKEKVAKLQETILAKHPSMPGLLRSIHETLTANPDQVTLLAEEEIQIIVSGLEVQTGTFLAQSISKPSTQKSVAAKIRNLGVEAFGG